MSMSTNIADLPGPSEEYDGMYEEDEYEYEHEDDMRHMEHLEDEGHEDMIEERLPKEVYYEQPDKISINIRKRKLQAKQEDDNILDMIKNEINEENLLILAVLYVSTLSIVEDYTKKLLSMLSLQTTSSLLVNVTKCVLLLILFLLAKHILLPYIRV